MKRKQCPICGYVGRLTAHHLLPISVRPIPLYYSHEDILRTVAICKKCHTDVHRRFSNKDLADNLMDPEKLITTMREALR